MINLIISFIHLIKEDFISPNGKSYWVPSLNQTAIYNHDDTHDYILC